MDEGDDDDDAGVDVSVFGLVIGLSVTAAGVAGLLVLMFEPVPELVPAPIPLSLPSLAPVPSDALSLDGVESEEDVEGDED